MITFFSLNSYLNTVTFLNQVNLFFYVPFFYVFSVICLFFSFKCVTSKNIIDVLFSLVMVFITSSGCLFCIHVEFLAIIHITVYVGAIIVLFLFSIMLLNFRNNRNIAFFHDSQLFNFIYFLLYIFFLNSVYDTLKVLDWVSTYSSEQIKPVLNEFENFKDIFFLNKNYQLFDLFYILNFYIDDTKNFIGLYLEYGIFLILVAIILLIVMIGSVSLCINAKKRRFFKKKFKKSF